MPFSFRSHTSANEPTASSFVLQDPQSQAGGEGVQLGRAAPHARQTEERDGGEQSRPEQGRLQEEPGRFRPARPCKLTRAPLSRTEPPDVWRRGDEGELFMSTRRRRRTTKCLCWF